MDEHVVKCRHWKSAIGSEDAVRLVEIWAYSEKSLSLTEVFDAYRDAFEVVKTTVHE